MKRRIYLSGPVEQSKDPATWREELQDRYGYIDFYNPLEQDEELYYNNKYRMVQKQLWKVQRSDLVLVNYIRGVETWGTPIEAFWAWVNGVPVRVWTGYSRDELPAYLMVIANKVSDDLERCVKEPFNYTE